jgi:hypothetical protein
MHSTEVPRFLGGGSRKVNVAHFGLRKLTVMAGGIFTLSRQCDSGSQCDGECVTLFEKAIDDSLEHGFDARDDPGSVVISI